MIKSKKIEWTAGYILLMIFCALVGNHYLTPHEQEEPSKVLIPTTTTTTSITSTTLREPHLNTSHGLPTTTLLTQLIPSTTSTTLILKPLKGNQTKGTCNGYEQYSKPRITTTTTLPMALPVPEFPSPLIPLAIILGTCPFAILILKNKNGKT